MSINPCKIYIKNVQVVCRQFLNITPTIHVGFKLRRVWLDTRSVCLKFVVQKVALEQSFLLSASSH
jgi:hypothetical protein